MILSFALALALAAQEPTVRPGLEPIAFLVGHCWRGELPTGEQDTHCFEPVYGGQHVRDRHEVTGGSGAYAGETFYSADGSGGVAFTYFNSLGGVSSGTMRPGQGRLNFGNEQYRGPEGREITLSIFWRRAGEDAYEVITASADAPAMNGTVRYERVTDAIAVHERRAPDGTTSLIHEMTIAASPQAVWEAIATAEGWKSWAVPVAWVDPDEPDVIETSYNPAATPGAPDTIRQRFLARIPGRMLAFRTIKAPAGFTDFDQFRHMLSVFELEPRPDGGTRVRLTGVGYPDSEAGKRLLAFFREGNKASLEMLRGRFEKGPVNWAERLGKPLR